MRRLIFQQMKATNNFFLHQPPRVFFGKNIYFPIASCFCIISIYTKTLQLKKNVIFEHGDLEIFKRLKNGKKFNFFPFSHKFDWCIWLIVTQSHIQYLYKCTGSHSVTSVLHIIANFTQICPFYFSHRDTALYICTHFQGQYL